MFLNCTQNISRPYYIMYRPDYEFLNIKSLAATSTENYQSGREGRHEIFLRYGKISFERFYRLTFSNVSIFQSRTQNTVNGETSIMIKLESDDIDGAWKQSRKPSCCFYFWRIINVHIWLK